MNRGGRQRLSEETVEIVQRGWYELEGAHVDIQDVVSRCLATTALYTPDQLEALLSGLPARDEAARQETQYVVANETTLAAARRLVVEHGRTGVMCLNFASAKNPGGGFLGGSQAQEESLARSSALYASLITQEGYYEANRECRTALYTDHMILSPDVPVFRGDDGCLLPEPYSVSMLTAPAVNAGAVQANQPGDLGQIRPTMASRIVKILAVAADNRYEHLVLGAWGCGVFHNSPWEVAELFSEALCGDERFRNRFASVTFAVLDSSPNRAFIAPFEHVFPDSQG